MGKVGLWVQFPALPACSETSSNRIRTSKVFPPKLKPLFTLEYTDGQILFKTVWKMVLKTWVLSLKYFREKDFEKVEE